MPCFTLCFGGIAKIQKQKQYFTKNSETPETFEVLIYMLK